MISNQENQSITFRSFLIGLAFSSLSAVMAQYSVNLIHASSLTIDHMPVAAIFLFFALMLFVHLLVKVIGKPLRLSSAELLGIYIMAFVGCTVSTMGLGSYLLPTISAPKYFADPSNSWDKLLLPHMKSWLMPQDVEAVRGYFEGIPRDSSIPWSVWMKPLSAWLPFLLALYLVMLCIPILMRKQWVEKERLQFPLAQVPLEMVRKENGRFVFFQNKLMWLGFAIPFVLCSINALHHYFNAVPAIHLSHIIHTFRHTQRLDIRLSFPVIGFLFIINREISFSMWFFVLLTHVISGWFNIAGLSSNENIGLYGSSSAIFNHVGTGALLVFVIGGLWMARAHLKEVCLKTFLRNAPVDDSEEILPYRTSLLAILVGIAFMVFWLTLSGLPALMALFFVILALLIFLGISRIVIEGGVPTLIAPGIAPGQLVSSFGTSQVGASGLTSLSFTFAYCADIRTFPMSAASNIMKIAEGIKKKRKLIFWAMVLSIVINLVTTLGVNLHLGYRYGALNLNSWYSVKGPQVAFDFAKDKILHPAVPNKLGWLCKFSGGAVMALLVFMRARFLWWPLHPIGWAIGSVLWIQLLWFSIFLAWLLKTVIIQFGGPRLHTDIKPFFLGLALGQYTAAALWFVIDLFTGMTGNMVFWI